MRIESFESGDVAIIELFGNIKTGDDYALFKSAIEDVIEQGKNKVVLNCKKVQFINSSGLGRLILASKRVKQSGGALKVTDLSEELRELFNFTMLDTKIEIYDTVDSAISTFMESEG